MSWFKNIFQKIEPPKLDLKELNTLEKEKQWRYLSELATPYFNRNKWRTFDKDILSFDEPLKTFFITQQFEMEVYNGGLLQFFTNSTGELSPYVSKALIKIGASKSEIIFKKAIGVISKFAENSKSLNQNLVKIKKGEIFQFSKIFDNQKLVEELNKLDTEFFNTGEQIDQLGVSFVKKLC